MLVIIICTDWTSSGLDAVFLVWKVVLVILKVVLVLLEVVLEGLKVVSEVLKGGLSDLGRRFVTVAVVGALLVNHVITTGSSKMLPCHPHDSNPKTPTLPLRTKTARLSKGEEMFYTPQQGRGGSGGGYSFPPPMRGAEAASGSVSGSGSGGGEGGSGSVYVTPRSTPRHAEGMLSFEGRNLGRNGNEVRLKKIH